MPYIVTFLILNTALCLFNLVLCVGIVRRLRQGETGAAVDQELTPQVMRAPGERILPFHAMTTAGRELSEDAFTEGSTLVGAFAQGCPECEERLPMFVEYAASYSSDPRRVIAVLVGDPDALRDKIAMLEPIAQVVLEGKDGPLGLALGVRGYPAFGILDAQAVVQTSSIRLEYLTNIPIGA